MGLPAEVFDNLAEISVSASRLRLVPPLPPEPSAYEEWSRATEGVDASVDALEADRKAFKERTQASLLAAAEQVASGVIGADAFDSAVTDLDHRIVDVADLYRSLLIVAESSRLAAVNIPMKEWARANSIAAKQRITYSRLLSDFTELRWSLRALSARASGQIPALILDPADLEYLVSLSGNLLDSIRQRLALLGALGCATDESVVRDFDALLSDLAIKELELVELQMSRPLPLDALVGIEIDHVGNLYAEKALEYAYGVEIKNRILDYQRVTRQLSEIQDARRKLRQVQESMAQIDLLASGDFDEPDEIMGQLQTSIRNGVEVVARGLGFLARSRNATPFIRALALETLAGARVHDEFDSLVLDAILDGIRSNDADLQFASIAAASDLLPEKQEHLMAFMDDISRGDFDPDVRRAASAFLQVMANLA